MPPSASLPSLTNRSTCACRKRLVPNCRMGWPAFMEYACGLLGIRAERRAAPKPARLGDVLGALCHEHRRPRGGPAKVVLGRGASCSTLDDGLDDAFGRVEQ